MVTLAEGMRETKDAGSRLFQWVEAGAAAAHRWLTGAPMTDRARLERQLAETAVVRWFGARWGV